MPDNLIEVQSVSQWNSSLRASKRRAIIVDFHAQWCGPCKTIAPHFAKLAESYPNVTFLRVDVDQQRAIATKYQVSAMPTFIAIRGGERIGNPVQGADMKGIMKLVADNAMPPAPELPRAAEQAKTAANELFKSEKWDEAIEKYSEALGVAPKSAVLLTNRSAARLKAGQLEDALADAEAATEADAEWSKAWQRLAEAHEALLPNDKGNVDTVREAYEKAIRLVPKGKQSSHYEACLANYTQ